MRQYWLFKSEPSVFSIEDLMQSPRQATCWEGVRNYQARNFLKTMKVGDQGFFYHSNADPPGIAGVVTVSKKAYPDHYAWDRNNKYYDPKSTRENPRWWMVDIRFVKKFNVALSLEALKEVSGLEHMELLRKGSRLSVQPVREKEWKIIMGLLRNGS